jgi:fatty acid desaturase
MIATLNSVRAVGATHRYRSVGEEYSLQRQFEDSVNVDSNRLDTLLLCPVGLRYHALHHAFPTLPYHALAEGHRRLLRVLPAGAPYHATIIGSVWQGWKELLEASARHRREGSQAAPEASIQPPARS